MQTPTTQQRETLEMISAMLTINLALHVHVGRHPDVAIRDTARRLKSRAVEDHLARQQLNDEIKEVWE